MSMDPASHKMEEMQRYTEGTLWQQYVALLGRNFTIKKRERGKTFAEFALPIYFLVILVVLRLLIPAPTFPAVMEPHDNGTLYLSVMRMMNTTLHVVPGDEPEVESVVDAVLAVTGGKAVYYDTEDQLLQQYRLSPASMSVGLVFPRSLLTNRSYTIRCNPVSMALPDPSARMIPSTSCRGAGFMVDGLESSFTCPPNLYYSSGFLGLQQLVDKAIMQVSGISTTSAATNKSIVVDNVRLQSFPLEAVVSTNLTVLRSIVPLYMVFTWAQFILYMLVLIVEEKEKKIKEGMKMMGLQGVVYWLSWLTVYGLYVIALATICTVVLPLAGVFQHANMGLVFLLFVLYGMSAIVMALMMTPFFSKAKVAGVVGNLVQVFMSLLFYLQVYLGDSIATVYYWLLALLSPCAFSLAIDKILVFDVTQGGLSVDTLWEGPAFPFAGSLIMISADIVIYLVLALYLDAVVPTEYGTNEKPWFFLMPSFWRKRHTEIKSRPYSYENATHLGDNDSSSTSSYSAPAADHTMQGRGSEDNIRYSEDIEPVGEDLRGKEAVIIRKLCKTFKRGRGKAPVHAVQDFTLTIYEGQITAILGHNGAGKTTLFNMLTGMTGPSGGTATIFGLDVSNSRDLREIRSMTGVCPQHDILFLVLTPREHLTFYARIRGVPGNEIADVVQRTLDEVDLLSKADSKAINLSGGQKRKLSIGIALIGDPHLIFLDEPTAGVDAYSRRRLWGLLRRRRRGKVILLTTHFMDEADVLADRKAVMTKGRLRCCGSSLFLKNKFGLGYHLTLVVSQDTVPGSVLAVIRPLIPAVTLARHFGKEMSFVLPHDSSGNFTNMFRLLDEYKSKTVNGVTIEDYGISMTTLEEVFLTLNTENEEEEEEDDQIQSFENLAIHLVQNKARSAYSLQRSVATSPGDAASPVSSNHETNTLQEHIKKGFAIEDVEVEYSAWRAFKALVLLRAIAVLREPVAIIFMVAFPLGFTVGSIALTDSQSIQVPSEKIIKLSTELVTTTLFPASSLFLNNTGHSLPGWQQAFGLSDMLAQDYNGSYGAIFEQRPQVAAFNVSVFPPEGSGSSSPSEVDVAYNTSFFHVLPVLLNIITNAAILQTSGNASDVITTYSSMFPSIEASLQYDASTFFAPFMIGFVYTLMPAGLAIDMVQDREIKARNLLRLNGVSFDLYFFSYLVTLGSIYLVLYAGLLIIIAAFQVTSLIINPAFGTLAVLYLLYLPSALIYAACFSYMFDKTETARQFYPNMGTTIGMVAYTVVGLVDMLVQSNGTDVAFTLHCIFTVTLPFYIPFGILYYINKVYLQCSIVGTCGDITLNDYMTPEILIIFFTCIFNAFFYYICLRVVDAWKTGGSIREALFMKMPADTPLSTLWQQPVVEAAKEDEDVKSERRLVQQLAHDGGAELPALIWNLGKVYSKEEEVSSSTNKLRCCSSNSDGKFVAVESVSLSLQPGEVLGLLGPNGAGKTTTLKIVTAEESATRGAVWVCGGRVSSVLSPSLSSLGYCPQHDCLWRRITVAEHLKLYCEVRGVKKQQLDSLMASYLDGLQISEHSDKQSQTCSGGTKRKLSYIISMMGRPSAVLLDEPSTGMDPKSKRFLWDSILASFRGHRSAILTTHAMEEADALCSRIGIMVKGALRCVGSVQSLKNKYGGGYNLEMKIKRSKKTEDSQAGQSENLLKVQSLIEDTFPDASLDEPPFEERLVYKVPQSAVQSLADCFQTLEQLKASGHVLEYAFSQTTLEQVFLLFAREQEMNEEEDEQEGGEEVMSERM